jgi:predicted DNA-binding transcriptional regulator AlpA
MEDNAQPLSRRRLANFDEVCFLLRISKTTGMRWRADPSMGFPAPMRLGPKTVRFDMDEVERWMVSRVSR